jgi:hypothetical protein
LKKQIRDPETAARASLQLEAIGTDGIPPLLEAVGSTDPEVRLYAAIALAYLDRNEAVRPLAELARRYPAFRVYALTALSAMQDYGAAEQLRGMLSSDSAETRYGAFRALTAMEIKDAATVDEDISRDFHYHVLDVAGPAMIHVTTSRQAEIVLFGNDQEFLTPLAVSAGNRIMVNSTGPTEVSVSRFAIGEADQKRLVSTRLDDVIRAIVELGGRYPDVVQALQEAKSLGALIGRFEVDALPEAGRVYQRTAAAGPEGVAPVGAVETTPDQPTPNLFDKNQKQSPQDVGDAAEKNTDGDAKPEKNALKKAKRRGLLSKIKRPGG